MPTSTRSLPGRRWFWLPLSAVPALLLLALLGLAPAYPAEAAGTVTQCADDTQFSAFVATGGAVSFNCGNAPVTITLTSEKAITVDTTIDGGGLVTLSGAQATRLFSVGVGVRLTLLNLTLVEGYDTYGGVIYSQGSLHVAGSTFFNNAADVVGAAIYAANGQVAVTTTNFVSNVANFAGAIGMNLGRLSVQGGVFMTNVAHNASGAIDLGTAPATIADAVFENNASESACCGVLYTSGPITIVNSLFRNNMSGGGGGGGVLGLENYDPNSLSAIRTTQFFSNHASGGGNGGAIELFLGQLELVGSTFAHNDADKRGGAINTEMSTTLSIDSSRFFSNTSLQDSGGAIMNFGLLTITTSSFDSNANFGQFVSYGGGAIVSDLPGNLWIYRSVFRENHSIYEGGAIDAGPAYVAETLFLSNTAAYGGAIDVYEPGFHIERSAFIGNGVVDTARDDADEGGAIDANSLAVWITNTTFFGNYAMPDGEGGAINGDGGPLTITHSTFYSNTAQDGYGGAFSGSANFVLRNSLVAFNPGGNCTNPLIFVGNNLQFGDTTCGTATVEEDPLLAPFPQFFGGLTPVVALLAGSPAIDAATGANCPATDQRGFARPYGTACDLGAFEAWYAVWLPLGLR